MSGHVNDRHGHFKLGQSKPKSDQLWSDQVSSGHVRSWSGQDKSRLVHFQAR